MISFLSQEKKIRKTRQNLRRRGECKARSHPHEHDSTRTTLNTKTYHLVQLLLEYVAYKYAKTKSDEYAVEE